MRTDLAWLDLNEPKKRFKKPHTRFSTENVQLATHNCTTKQRTKVNEKTNNSTSSCIRSSKGKFGALRRFPGRINTDQRTQLTVMDIKRNKTCANEKHT